jgi:predicted ferric reductase
MSKGLKASFWIGVYLVLTLGPLILLLVTPRPPQREFWREVAVALGFAGLSLMGLQFIPTARLKFLSDVFPMDTTYYFHHWTSVLSTLFIVAHPLILIGNNPHVLILFDLANAPWRARAGIAAALAVLALTVLSVWRKDLKLEYEPWRLLHNVLAIGAAGLALWHIFGVRYYLASSVQRVLWIALAAVWGGFLGYVKLYKPWTMLRRPYRIKEIREERGNCWTLAVEAVGHGGLTFHAGQFAWLTVGKSPFAIREHPFSFSSSAERAGPLEFTIKELGDFTSRVKELEPGVPVYVDGPYGEFCVDEHEAPGYVFLAGGIGSAPMMSVLRTLADRGSDCPLYLFYGNLNWEQVIFCEEIKALKEQLNLQVVHVLEEPAPNWEGETGYITTDILDRYLPDNRKALIYFISGPVPMIDAVKSSLRELGIPRGHVCEEQYEMA